MKYPDTKGHWAESAIDLVTRWGLMEGYPDGTFGPDEPVTRAQFAKVLRRVMDSIPANRLIQQSMPGVTYIISTFEEGMGIGSGFWVAPWIILTNAHVVSRRDLTEAARVDVFGDPNAGWSPMDACSADVMDIWHEFDLALLAVHPPYYPIEPHVLKISEEEPVVGDLVWALGHPFGDPFDACSGTIRHRMRGINYWQRVQQMKSLAVPINPGNSGGPILNTRGEVVGVSAAGRSGSNLYTFAIPQEHIRQVLRSNGL